LPHPFDNEVDNNNYFLASLWLYLIGLSKALNTLSMLVYTITGKSELQEKITLKIHKVYAWSPLTLVIAIPPKPHVIVFLNSLFFSM
jgi:hypothetical protein